MNRYFIGKNGNSLGPFDESTVLDLLRSGSFSPHDAGCLEGMNEWKPLSVLLPTLVVVQPPVSVVHSPKRGGSGSGIAIAGIGLMLTFFSGLAIVWARDYIQKNVFTSGLGGIIGYQDSTYDLAQGVQAIAPLVLIVGLILLVAGGVLAFARRF